jgi:hypothetical protein
MEVAASSSCLVPDEMPWGFRDASSGDLLPGETRTPVGLPSPKLPSAVGGNICYGEWRSLAARLLWEQEAAGSNPASPTDRFRCRRIGVGIRFGGR